MADVLRFPLNSGVREDTDPKGLPPGTLLTGVNVRQDKAGRVRKRRGVTALATSTVLDTYSGGRVTGELSRGVRLVSRTGRDLGLHDGTNVWEFGESPASWRRIERSTPFTATWDVYSAAIESVLNGEAAVAGAHLVSIVCTGTGATGVLLAKVTHRESGAVVLPPKSLGIGALPKVLVRDTSAFFFWSDGTDRKGVVLDLTTMSFGVTQTLASGCVSNDTFGVCDSGSSFYLVTELSAGANRTAVRQLNASLAVVGTADVNGNAATATSFAHVHLDAVAGEYLWASICSGSGAGLPSQWLFRIDLSTLAILTGPVSATANRASSGWIVRRSATRVVVARCCETSLTPNHTSIETEEWNASTLATTSPTRRAYNAELASEPWLDDSGRIFCAANASHKEGGFGVRANPKRKVLLEVEYEESALTTGLPLRVAAIFDTTSGGRGSFSTGSSYLPAIAEVSNDEALLLAPTLEEPQYANEVRRQAMTLFRVARELPRPLSLGLHAFLPSAAPSFDDGVNVHPAGFVDSPAPESLTASNLGGSMATGTYQYVFWYEWIDSAGLKHRSVPSAAYSVAVTGPTGSVTILVQSTTLGTKYLVSDDVLQPSPGVEIVVARTKAGGSTYYRLSKEPDGLVVMNDVTARNVTFVDVYADSDIDPTTQTIPLATQPQVYTEGGVLDSVAPPGMIAATLHGQRIYGIAGDRRTLLASTSMAEDPRVAPYFNEALSLWFDEDKVALASLDARLVVFAADGIDVLDGDGPDVTGNARDWRVSRIQTDVGCTNAASVVAFPGGVFFQASKGLMMLSRGLEVSWVGRAVRDRLEAFPIITSACLVADEHEVRFTCTTTDGLSGLVLVFDYEHGAWYTRTYAKAFVDSLVVGGVWHALAADGTVYRESSVTSLDDGAYVESEVEFVATSQALAGWTRLKAVDLIGTSLSNHDLEVSLARDFAISYEQTKTFAAQGQVTTAGPLEWARVHPATQKAKGFRVRVRDLEPSTGALGTGEGLMLDGIAVHIQTKRGPGPVSAERKG